MKYSAFFVSASLFALSILASCTKNHDSVIISHFTDEESVNEMLSFSNLSEFENAIRRAENDGVFITKTKSSTFYSLYDSLIEETLASLDEAARAEIEKDGLEFEPLDDYIGSAVFMSFLNTDREIAIDGKIYRYVSNGVFVYPNSSLSGLIDSIDVSQFDCMVDGEVQPMDNGIVFHRIDYSPSTEAPETKLPTRSDGFYLKDNTFIQNNFVNRTQFVKKGGDGSAFRNLIANMGGIDVLSINEFDKKHRMVVRVYDQNLLVYHGTGMTVRFQKKVAGIWFNKAADDMRYGCLGPLCKYEYKSPVQIIDEAIIKPAPKQTYSKPIVLFNLSLPYLKSFSVTNQTIESLLYKALQNKQASISKFLNNNPDYKSNARGVFSQENPNTVYYLFPAIDEKRNNDGRAVLTWDNDWIIGGALTYNLTTGSISGNINLPSVRNIEILRVFSYGAVKYDGVWRACIIYC